MTAPGETDEQVLSTLNKDGSRRKIRPRLSPGRFLTRRRVVAYALILIFTAIPYLRLGGKPLVLLDLPAREFTFFGKTFLPTDTVLLMLLLVTIIVAIVLLTALFGRVWCGWACPQTVYMEFLYRPIERLIEGSPQQQRKLDREGANGRRVLKNVVFLAVSVFLAHTFLAYFVGVDRLLQLVQQSPLDHPAAFLVMASTTALMFFDFAWFREQTCIVACPYGRLQSVLLDRQSLIVGYDAQRGEPRGKLKGKGALEGGARGDCIDCGACVVTCPTGIDIREGLQMECIGCTQCIDACDAIMERIGKPRGLIRYSSEDALEGKRSRILRPRVVIYPALLAVFIGLFGLALGGQAQADVTVLRGIGSPFSVLDEGEVSNQLRVKVVNRTSGARRYRIELLDAPGARLIAPQNPIPIDAGRTETAVVFVVAPIGLFDSGSHTVRLRLTDGEGFEHTVSYRLLGPAKNSAIRRGSTRSLS